MQKGLIFFLAIGVIIMGLFFAARRQRQPAAPVLVIENQVKTSPSPTVSPAATLEPVAENTLPAAPVRDALTTTLMQTSLDFAERYGNPSVSESWLERFESYLTPELKRKLASATAPKDQTVQAVGAKPVSLALASGRATFHVEVLRTTVGKTTPATLVVSLEKRGETWLVSGVNWK